MNVDLVNGGGVGGPEKRFQIIKCEVCCQDKKEFECRNSINGIFDPCCARFGHRCVRCNVLMCEKCCSNYVDINFNQYCHTCWAYRYCYVIKCVIL